MLEAPVLPLKVRATNATLNLAARFGATVDLGEDALLETACKTTGLQNFGPDSYRHGLERLLESLREEAALSPVGRIIARQEILMALGNRLQLVDQHRRFPDIGTATIERPIFIIGMGRSGTTILHELLSLDEHLRTPRTWEVDHPFPPPVTATYRTDPRIATVQKTLDRADLILPRFKRIHRMGAELPQECVRFTTGEFLSLIFWTNYNVPSYARWLKTEADMAPAYRYHREYLQILQWHHPASPWVLKSPAHLWSLDELLKQYPDARFVQTHRDPLKMLASLTSLVTHLRKMSSDRVDPLQIAREWAQWNALGLNASAAFRASGRIAPDNIVDIDFYAFIEAPLTQLKKIYDKFEMNFSEQAQTAMNSYLQSHSAHQHGGHGYDFADTGLDLEEERARVAPYQDYFNARIEIS